MYKNNQVERINSDLVVFKGVNSFWFNWKHTKQVLINENKDIQNILAILIKWVYLKKKKLN